MGETPLGEIMKIVADLGYTKFSCDEEELKEKLVLGNHNPEEDFVISAYDLFNMLKALPKGVKWNPYTEDFEEQGV